MEEEYLFRKDFRSRFFEIMKKKGLRVIDVQKKTGLSGSIIGNYRDGRTIPNAYSVMLICKAFGVSADWLLGLSDKGGPEE